MRLPLITEIESRDGAANKDERLTNTLMEIEDQEFAYAAIRPGLATIASSTGNGNGLTTLDGVLIGVFGTTAFRTASITSIDTVADGIYDFAQGAI